MFYLFPSVEYPVKCPVSIHWVVVCSVTSVSGMSPVCCGCRNVRYVVRPATTSQTILRWEVGGVQADFSSLLQFLASTPANTGQTLLKSSVLTAR